MPSVSIAELPSTLRDEAVELWRRCDLVRPWNDPMGDLDRALGGPASTVLAAMRDQALVGTVMVGHDGHRAWVYYLAVDANVRRGGIGRRLMEAAEGWAAAQGMPKVQLMVRASNREVVAFYESLEYDDQQTITFGKFMDPRLQQLRRGSSERTVVAKIPPNPCDLQDG